jgi:hypothetical protein
VHEVLLLLLLLLLLCVCVVPRTQFTRDILGALLLSAA